MNWTTPGELRARLLRLWERGELLRPLVTCEETFPRRLAIKGPSSAELAAHFDTVRGWVAELVAAPQIRLEWREINHRLHGTQRLPHCAWVDTLDEALALIGKRADAARFKELLALTHAKSPALQAWLARRPLQAIELAGAWPRLLDVVAWMEQHPRPGIYLRQVDISGIHSKFIEAHRAVLAELFDLVLPPTAIATEQTGVVRFAPRYGFLDKPTRIRLRVLDARLGLLSGAPTYPIGATGADVALDADSFARLDVPVRHVFITENETNFLAFPSAADSLVIFGAGYGWDALSQATWLRHCAIYYWGDIDTHGFAILDHLRRRFAHVESLLMDRTTLMAHEPLWGSEPEQVTRDLPDLTEDEQLLYNDLRDNRIRRNLRLEQEMIGFDAVRAAVNRLIG